MNESARTPYTALNYLIGECNYGGHVTDESDHRLLQTILKKFLNISVENPSHAFGPIEAYILPRRLEYREIVRYIEEVIPSEPSCELFGLHKNAGFANRLDRSQQLLDLMTISANMTRSSNLDESEAELCLRLNEIVNKIPGTIDLSAHRPPSDLMTHVLQQEIGTYNTIAEVVRESCVHVIQAIQGTNENSSITRTSVTILFCPGRFDGTHSRIRGDRNGNIEQQSAQSVATQR